jgi:hypothetical protein
MTGASGGMLGATYYRELYRMKQAGDSLNIYDKQYVENISKDLLNGCFLRWLRGSVMPRRNLKLGRTSM